MNPETLLHAAREAHRKAAETKAQLDHLEHYRRHIIAKLMIEAEKAGARSVAAQEKEALGSEAYLTFLKGLEAARVASALAEWDAKESVYRIELYRTQQANQRQERKAYNV